MKSCRVWAQRTGRDTVFDEFNELKANLRWERDKCGQLTSAPRDYQWDAIQKQSGSALNSDEGHFTVAWLQQKGLDFN